MLLSDAVIEDCNPKGEMSKLMREFNQERIQGDLSVSVAHENPIGRTLWLEQDHPNFLLPTIKELLFFCLPISSPATIMRLTVAAEPRLQSYFFQE